MYPARWCGRRYRLVKIDTDKIDSQLVSTLMASIERHTLSVDWLLAEYASLEQLVRMQQLGYSVALLRTPHLQLKDQAAWTKRGVLRRAVSLPLLLISSTIERPTWQSLFAAVGVPNWVLKEGHFE